MIFQVFHDFQSLWEPWWKFLDVDPHERYTCRSDVNDAPANLMMIMMMMILQWLILALNAPIATKVVCFSCLLKCLRSLYGKQCGPRSDSRRLQQTTFSEAFFSWRFKGYFILGYFIIWQKAGSRYKCA